MSDPRFDLSAYLARIGFTGAPAPDAATLHALCRLHPMAIPFENLTPFLGGFVQLDIVALQRKMIAGRRGGYCFEQNTLVAHALRAIGFPVTGLAARVLWNAPPDTIAPQTHMLLRVRADGAEWLVDSGFGGVTLTAPLRLDVRDADQATPHGAFRLEGDSSEARLSLRAGGALRPMFRFTPETRYPPDYEMANHYLCTLPESRFRTRLIVSRPVADGRLVLHNRELTIYRPDGEERRELTPPQVVAAVADRFGIDIPDPDALLRAVEALPQ